jgi:hypothetical protein
MFLGGRNGQELLLEWLLRSKYRLRFECDFFRCSCLIALDLFDILDLGWIFWKELDPRQVLWYLFCKTVRK